MAEIELDEQEYLIPLAMAGYGWMQQIGHIAKVNGIEFSVVNTKRNRKPCLVISDLKSGMLVSKYNLSICYLARSEKKTEAMVLYREVLSDFAEFSKDKIEIIKGQSEKWLEFMTETYGGMPEIVAWKGMESGVE